ncbi:hypothetical protein [Streptomyces sp. NBC_01353]|uniref:hypothetical protein n=1 Tax=Streptomyces sp. NBC_01353 TaxID=2903835 RepID=UPI002E304465|nr:hypothetical protein [Streptomyces sp. NBC_01353]
MTATAATSPLLNGQTIGIAYHAIAAVRDRLLAASGLTFHQSVALNAVAAGLDRAGAVDRMAATLKIGEPEALALLDELADAGLIDGPRMSITDKGVSLQRGFTDAVAGLAERLYGDLPATEREIAARALAHVTAKANAELAAR